MSPTIDIKGRMNFVDNVVNPKSGTIRGRAVFDNKDGMLTPGYFGWLRLFGGEHATLLVPDSAIASDQSRQDPLHCCRRRYGRRGSWSNLVRL